MGSGGEGWVDKGIWEGINNTLTVQKSSMKNYNCGRHYYISGHIFSLYIQTV